MLNRVEDAFSLEALIAWLEKQPADTAYEWYRPEGCFVALYLMDVTGTKEPWSLGKTYKEVFPSHDAYLEVGGTRPWTFGAALDRARKIASSPVQP